MRQSEEEFDNLSRWTLPQHLSSFRKKQSFKVQWPQPDTSVLLRAANVFRGSINATANGPITHLRALFASMFVYNIDIKRI